MIISENYKENFPWVDHISPVRGTSIRKQLDNVLFERIKSKDENVWMAVPEIINWEDTAGFRYQGSREIHDDILIDKVIAARKNPVESIDQLKRTKIYEISAIDEQEKNHWLAYKCLYGEIEFNGGQYCINGGEWFRVDHDYVKEINNEYFKTIVSSYPFPEYAKNEINEASYNEHLCSQSADNCILMDLRIIVHGEGRSRFELCDILIPNESLVHIKRYSGSAPLSHLFNQGLTTAQLIRTDPSFLQKANSEISRAQNSDSHYAIDSKQPSKIVFAIITKDRNQIPDIPFFSKITFCNTKKILKLMGFEVEIASIQREK